MSSFFKFFVHFCFSTFSLWVFCLYVCTLHTHYSFIRFCLLVRLSAFTHTRHTINSLSLILYRAEQFSQCAECNEFASFSFSLCYGYILFWIFIQLVFGKVWNWNEKIRVLFCLYPCIFIRRRAPSLESFCMHFQLYSEMHAKIKRFERETEWVRDERWRHRVQHSRATQTHTHNIKGRQIEITREDDALLFLFLLAEVVASILSYSRFQCFPVLCSFVLKVVLSLHFI